MGALVIHVLLPRRVNPPSVSSAVVSIPAGSEPWLGSVRPLKHVNCVASAVKSEPNQQNIQQVRPLL